MVRYVLSVLKRNLNDLNFAISFSLCKSSNRQKYTCQLSSGPKKRCMQFNKTSVTGRPIYDDDCCLLETCLLNRPGLYGVTTAMGDNQFRCGNYTSNSPQGNLELSIQAGELTMNGTKYYGFLPRLGLIVQRLKGVHYIQLKFILQSASWQKRGRFL